MGFEIVLRLLSVELKKYRPFDPDNSSVQYNCYSSTVFGYDHTEPMTKFIL